VVITSRGGLYEKGSARGAFDFQEPYLQHIPGFIGLTDITFIHAENQSGGQAQRQVLAGRLSEDPNLRVALLEAGGADDAPEISMPVAFLTYRTIRYCRCLTDAKSLLGAGSPEDLALVKEGHGPLTSNIAEAGVFLSTRGDESVPDRQFEMAPAMYFNEGLSAPSDHAFTMTTTQLKPTSRGRVTLRSARPDAKPRISHSGDGTRSRYAHR
jgi:choline dehydrogenase-like flavoprotein